MSEQMSRAIASDKSDPSNFPKDNGLRHCNGCDEDIKTEEDVEEFSHCYQHFSTVEELREECFHKVRDIKTLYQRLKERDEKVVSLNKWIDHLESQVRYRDGHIEELQSALTKSQEHFDRMNQIVQAYEKLLKGEN